MKLSIRFADKIVGTLVVLAVGILIFVIIMLGKNQHWFSRDYNFLTYFPSAVGLSQNMPIQYKGFTIGRVKSIELVSKDGIDQVETKFIVFDDYIQWVKDDSYVEMVASPLGALVGNQFLFHPGSGERLIKDEEGRIIFLEDKKKLTFIPSMNSPEWQQMVAEGRIQEPEHKDAIVSIMNNVDELIAILNDALKGSGDIDGAEKGETNLRQLVEDLNAVIAGMKPVPDDISSALNELTPALNELTLFANQLNNPGSVAKLLDSDGKVFDELGNSLEALAGTLKNLEKTTDNLDLRSAITSVQEILDYNPLLRLGSSERKETNIGGAYSRDNTEF